VHIPDGYLSPQTCAVAGAAMVPVWAVSARRVKTKVKQRDVPLMAIGAAFCFLVMMLNVPIPDGTTAHAVGGVLVAVLLGPEAAIIAVSVALAIQALFFGDGGILAFGANCFNMAFLLPVVGYGVYRLLSRRLSLTDPKRAAAAGIGGYIGINVAAFCCAIELGLQPVLFTTSDGTPLYAPFHLSQTIPAMMLAHLLVAGVVELVLTAGVVAYLQKANLPVLRINHEDVPDVDADLPPEPAGLGWRWALVGLGALAATTPLGLLAPGGAFGEAAPAGLDLHQYGLRAIPSGLNRYNGFWSHALLNGYGFGPGQNRTVGYLASAAVGIAVIAVAVVAVWFVISHLRLRGTPARVEAGIDATPAPVRVEVEVGA
jgi:cobalt/nickel transport system permease protein